MKSANAADVHRLWLFGKSYDFYPVSTTETLGVEDFDGTVANPTRRQKSQIVLHCTAGNNPAENTIRFWRGSPISAGAHYVVERSNVAQAARPAPAGSAPDANDQGAFVDAVRCCDEDIHVSHGGPSNRASIGIEHANVGWGWFAASTATEPSLAGRHSPLSTCPSPTNTGSTAAPDWRCNHARPRDLNRFIRLPFNHGGYTDYQSYEDEQYATMILLLRHLCITHRIPRQFLGRTREEVFRFWHYGGAGATQRTNRAGLHRFRGIFYHRNTHDSKQCPGIINRNRLFRGIIDEWWLPVDLSGPPRDYYSGPFKAPAWDAANPTVTAPSCFRCRAPGTIEGAVYRDADIDALNETRSYFDLDQVERYYAAVETRRGGHFPIGTNRIWHGGVHFDVTDQSPCVHAAAGGTIVAARVSGNADTAASPDFGHQGFVLIRHRVHLAREADPDGLGERIDYTAEPPIVFSLYMHIAPPADLAAEHDENPPWFNIWRRANPGVDVGMDGEKGRVFDPEIEVSVGDILGIAGMFRQRRTLHFEVLTRRNQPLTMAPWDAAANIVEDTDQDAICDVPGLDGFVRDRYSDGIDVIDVLAAAPGMREVRALHKTEWSLSAEAQLAGVIRNPRLRQTVWTHISRFTWVSEAIAANAALANQFAGADGLLWHYHPIRFMEHVNRLILGENRERREEEYHDTNVEVDEGDFITRYVDWSSANSRFEPANTDAERIQTHQTSALGNLAFRRNEISCTVAGNHRPGPTPAQGTKFSLALLEVLTDIRKHYNAGITIERAHVCDGHRATAGVCSLGTAEGAAQHHAGVAVDIRPSNPNPARCASLYRSTTTIEATFDRHCADACAQPTQADLPDGYDALDVTVVPASAAVKLQSNPAPALTAAEAAAFRMHLALRPTAVVVPRASTSPLLVRLRVVFESILVVNDQDSFAEGEWSLSASVNGRLAGQFSNRATSTGETIRPGWERTVELDPALGQRLSLFVSGSEEDLTSADSLGSVRLSFDQHSTPAWGIGRRSLLSSNGSFELTFSVESLNTGYG